MLDDPLLDQLWRRVSDLEIPVCVPVCVSLQLLRSVVFFKRDRSGEFLAVVPGNLSRALSESLDPCGNVLLCQGSEADRFGRDRPA
jgi:hypothetical protein